MCRIGILLLLVSVGTVALAQGPQTGIGAMPMQFGLLPGQAQMVVAYCGSLLGDAPTFRDRYLPAEGGGSVALEGGPSLDLREAVETGMLLVRGPSPLEVGRRGPGLWVDLYAVNTSPMPLWVEIRPGAVFRPVGSAPAKVPRLQKLASILGEAGLAGTDLACLATWVATGSTRADLEHTLVRLLTEAEIEGVRRALSEAKLPQTVPDGSEEYATRYAEALAGLGKETARREAAVRFPSGLEATLVIIRSSSGQAVAQARTAAGRTLSYGATVQGDPAGAWTVQLLNLKTGRPVPGLPQYVLAPPEPASAK